MDAIEHLYLLFLWSPEHSEALIVVPVNGQECEVLTAGEGLGWEIFLLHTQPLPSYLNSFVSNLVVKISFAFGTLLRSNLV